VLEAEIIQEAWHHMILLESVTAHSNMETRCLDIPTDHRLRKTLNRQYQRDELCGERSDHLRILEEFGQTVRLEMGNAQESALPIPEIDFCLELARPERVGRVVVVLQQPDPSQIYNDGYATEEARCKTLAAVKELVHFGSGGTMDTDCVTILDCMPFVIDDYDGSDFHQKSQDTFLRALEAKKPDLVISCFRTETPRSERYSLPVHYCVNRADPGRGASTAVTASFERLLRDLL